MYKCSIGHAPDYLRELIVPYAPARTLRSASLNLVVQPKAVSKSYGERSYSYIGPTLWNALPNWIKTSPSIDSFKRNLKSFLFKQHYQS